ncbi:MAG: hypothetical protein R3240_13150 [Gammaproteobacteria bacterium]|nr:hypothetical protein [Gammaproteobacteria bacterium]
MFSIFIDNSENSASSSYEQDEQNFSLEAMHGDSAVIQAVNELNQLKTPEKNAA